MLKIDGSPEFHRALAAALAEKLSDRIDEVQLLDANQAGQMLGVTAPTFREIAKREAIGSVDLGERGARWSISELKALIKKREVKGR